MISIQDSQRNIWAQGSVLIDESRIVKPVCELYLAFNSIKTYISQKLNYEDAIEGLVIW